MADPAVQRTDYYVYALFREDGDTPFYIGKGCGRRIVRHARQQSGRSNSERARITSKVIEAIGYLPHAILADGMTNHHALLVERDMIRLVGRQPSGPLVNIKSGWDGAIPNDAFTAARRRNGALRSWADPEKRAKRLKTLKITPEYRSGPDGAVAAECQRAGIIAYWSDPKRSDANREQRRQFMKDHPELIHTDAMLSPGSRRKSIEANRRPEVRAKRVAAQKAAFSTPEAKAKRSAVAKLVWVRRKAQKTLPSATARELKPS